MKRYLNINYNKWLTDIEVKIMDFIGIHGRSGFLQDIADHLGYSMGGVEPILRKLVKSGYIKKTRLGIYDGTRIDIVKWYKEEETLKGMHNILQKRIEELLLLFPSDFNKFHQICQEMRFGDSGVYCAFCKSKNIKKRTNRNNCCNYDYRCFSCHNTFGTFTNTYFHKLTAHSIYKHFIIVTLILEEYDNIPNFYQILASGHDLCPQKKAINTWSKTINTLKGKDKDISLKYLLTHNIPRANEPRKMSRPYDRVKENPYKPSRKYTLINKIYNNLPNILLTRTIFLAEEYKVNRFVMAGYLKVMLNKGMIKADFYREAQTKWWEIKKIPKELWNIENDNQK